jgi:hypothetical protein
MHTSLQASLIRELHNVLPENAQLWINTHSFGIIQEAREIEKTHPGSVSIIDFADRDFDSQTIITPSKVDKILWEKFLSVSFGDFSKMIAPASIYICEGDFNGIRRKDFDAEIYTRIFRDKYPDCVFLSGGACNDIIKDDSPVYVVLKNLLRDTIVTRLIDRDDYSSGEVAAFATRQIKVLTERNLESYLFDDEILRLFVDSIDPAKWASVVTIKQNAMSSSVARGNAPDDVKSASGEIYVEMKKVLGLTGCGNNADAFMRDTLSNFIVDSTTVFGKLERDLFL